MSGRTDEKEEKEECVEEEKKGEEEADWRTWTDPLEDLVEIEGAFEVDEKDKLRGKTILDVGTDCVKPIYMALKFEPDKIVGINEDFSPYSFASDIERKSKLLTKTKIHFYNCSFFDDENLKKILREEKEEKFDFVLVSKTLHHLRTGKCIVAEERNKKHECLPDEKCCIYKFKEQEIFDRLFRFGNTVIIFEAFYPHEEDDDKVRGRGGYFTIKEWEQIFSHLSENYRVNFVKPLRFQLDKKEFRQRKQKDIVIAKLRQVDYVCFFVKTK